MKTITLLAGTIWLLSSSAMAANWEAISPDRCVTTRGAAVSAAQNDSYSVKSRTNAGYGSAEFVLCVQKGGIYNFWYFEPTGTKFCRTARRQLGTSLDSNGNCPSTFP